MATSGVEGSSGSDPAFESIAKDKERGGEEAVRELFSAAGIYSGSMSEKDVITKLHTALQNNNVPDKAIQKYLKATGAEYKNKGVISSVNLRKVPFGDMTAAKKCLITDLKAVLVKLGVNLSRDDAPPPTSTRTIVAVPTPLGKRPPVSSGRDTRVRVARSMDRVLAPAPTRDGTGAIGEVRTTAVRESRPERVTGGSGGAGAVQTSADGSGRPVPTRAPRAPSGGVQAMVRARERASLAEKFPTKESAVTESIRSIDIGTKVSHDELMNLSENMSLGQKPAPSDTHKAALAAIAKNKALRGLLIEHAILVGHDAVQVDLPKEGSLSPSEEGKFCGFLKGEIKSLNAKIMTRLNKDPSSSPFGSVATRDRAVLLLAVSNATQQTLFNTKMAKGMKRAKGSELGYQMQKSVALKSAGRSHSYALDKEVDVLALALSCSQKNERSRMGLEDAESLMDRLAPKDEILQGGIGATLLAADKTIEKIGGVVPKKTFHFKDSSLIKQMDKEVGLLSQYRQEVMLARVYAGTIPEGWDAQFNSSGGVKGFINTATGETSKELPTRPVYAGVTDLPGEHPTHETAVLSSIASLSSIVIGDPDYEFVKARPGGVACVTAGHAAAPQVTLNYQQAVEQTRIANQKKALDLEPLEHRAVIKFMAKITVSSNAGNCDLVACAAAEAIEKGVRAKARRKVPPRLEIVKGDGHQFVVVGRKKGSDLKDSSTWGPDAFIVDVWDHNLGGKSPIVKGNAAIASHQQDFPAVKTSYEYR